MSRLITLPMHSAIELGLGAALMVSPFVFGFGAAALVTAVAIGALLVGIALAGTGGEGRGTIPVATHAAYDLGIAVGLVVAALLLGIAGDGAALLTLAVVALAHMALSAATRYTTAGA